MKERLTITLDKDLLIMIDSTIDGVKIRNRSHAIEQLLISSVKQGKPKKAVIFAGGNPITVNGKRTSIPMAIVKGRPIIDYILDELKRNGITEVIVALGRESESLFGHLADGRKIGMEISYVREDSPRGTEGALELVRDKVGNEPFFALNGDNIFTIDLGDMYRQHIANGAIATIALTPAGSRLRFGVTKLEGNRITSFIQKHDQQRAATLVNAGIYLFSPDIFDFIGATKAHIMLEESLFPKLVSSGKLFGYVFSGSWRSYDSTMKG